jgi:hypothetical protein
MAVLSASPGVRLQWRTTGRLVAAALGLSISRFYMNIEGYVSDAPPMVQSEASKKRAKKSAAPVRLPSPKEK